MLLRPADQAQRHWRKPVLGPSTTWLLRRLVAGFDAAPEGYELDLAVTARSLGLGARAGQNSPFLRALERSRQFSLTRDLCSDVLGVRRRLALSLFELDEDRESAERQLHQWHFHPAVAHDAVNWAWDRHRIAARRQHDPIDGTTGDAA